MDLFTRLHDLIEEVGPISVMVGAIAVVAMLLIAISNKRAILISTFLFCLMLSGCVIEAVDQAGTLARWCVMLMLAVTCVHGSRWPGLGAVMMGAFALSSAMYIPLSPSPMYGLQFSVLLLIASIPMSMALAHYLQDIGRIRFVLRLVLLAAGFYALVGFATLSMLRSGSRFSGIGSSAPLFVITGGLLMPVALWAALNETSKMWRLYAMAIGGTIVMLCLISGQRTGTYAGFIACLPLVARLGLRRLLVCILVIATAALLLWAVVMYLPEQADFIKSRYSSFDLTGRESRWSRAIELCWKSPVIGHGPGSSASRYTGFGFHNAYLMAWYEGGLLGLLLFTGAYVAIGVQALYLGFVSRHPQSQEIARLVLGLILGLGAAGIFEGKTLSPSNIAMFFALLGSILVARLSALQRLPQRLPPVQVRPQGMAPSLPSIRRR